MKIKKKLSIISILLSTVAMVSALDFKITDFCSPFKNEISVGGRGRSVIALQKVLQIKQTGYFGLATQKALNKYQVKNNLAVSGKLDIETFNFINKKYCIETYKISNYFNPNDVIEVKDLFTIYEKKVPDVPMSVVYGVKNEPPYTSNIPTILKFNSQMIMGAGDSVLWVDWEAYNFDYCSIYEVREGKYVDNKFVPIFRDTLSFENKISGHFEGKAGSTLIRDYKKDVTVIQIECTNKKKKIVERKSNFLQ